MIIAGADSFEVLTSNYNAAKKEYELNLKTPDLSLDVDYSITAKLNSSYLAFKVNAIETLYLEIKPTNFHAELTFGNAENGALMVTKIVVREKFSPQEGIYHYGPEFQKDIDAMFVTKDKGIDNAIENYLLPIINDALSQFRTVEELALRIKEAAGDNNNGILGSRKC